MLFNFLKYISPTNYFNLVRINDTTAFPNWEILPDEIKEFNISVSSLNLTPNPFYTYTANEAQYLTGIYTNDSDEIIDEKDIIAETWPVLDHRVKNREAKQVLLKYKTTKKGFCLRKFRNHPNNYNNI